MKLILKYNGQPTDHDLSFMTEDSAIQYIKDMGKGLKPGKTVSNSDLGKL